MFENIPDYILKTSNLEVKKLGLIPTWSYSALKDYEKCPHRSYLKKVKKIEDPSGPAAKRGNEIHEQAEHYINGTIGEMPDTLKKFESSFKEFRELYSAACVTVEEDWGFTKDWEPCGWTAPDVWARIKIDAFVEQDQTSARVIDFKTGKKWGNEITHSMQCLLYAIGAFYRIPQLEFIQTELWYLDKKETMEKSYSREQAMVFAPNFQKRAVDMTSATTFPPTPSINACKWCSYGKGDDPVCPHGIYT